MASIQKVKLNRRIITFIFCVMASFFFWLMMSLSKEYKLVVNFPVSYINLPLDKVLANHLPETIDIEIEASGFNLMVYKWKEKNEVISMDIKDAKPMLTRNHFYLLGNSRIDKITSQFTSDIHIVKLFPDTIFLDYNKKFTKRVPIKSNVKVSFQNQYQQSDSIILNPKFVDVSGSEELVEKIKYVETVPQELKGVGKSMGFDVALLKTSQIKAVELSQEVVHGTINVTKYTETSMEVPVDVEHLPLGYELKTFPDKVMVKYNVALTNYEKINVSMFRLAVDFNKAEAGSNKLKVQVIKSPKETWAIKINPEKVEYIIKK